MADARIAYGAFCTWWDSIDKVGTNGGLSCCPHCKGVLYEMPTLLLWMTGVQKYDAAHPGYADMVVWGRGKCFPGLGAITRAYDARPPETKH